MGKGFTRVAAAIVSLGVLAPIAASAQGDAIANRKNDFQILRKSFGDVKTVVDGKAGPDAALAPAQTIAEVAKRISAKTNFPAGSDKGDTKVLASIWTDAAGFDARAKALETAADAMVVAAAAKNVDGIKAAFGDAAKSCGACHDAYRAK